MLVDLSGDYRTEIYDCARKALNEGADPDEQIETYRDGKISMRGRIGDMALLTVKENASIGPIITYWSPHPASAVTISGRLFEDARRDRAEKRKRASVAKE